MMSWQEATTMFRVNPQAVCRQLLAQIEDQETLSADEQEKVELALKNCGVPNATTRVLTGASRTVLQMLLGELRVTE